MTIAYDENPFQYAVTRVNASNLLTSQELVVPTIWDNDSIVLDINNYPLGTYYFTCTVSDNDNQTSSSTCTINVIEKDEPLINFPLQTLTYQEDLLGQSVYWNAGLWKSSP